jgi:outer membrane protein assembly factor BamB
VQVLKYAGIVALMGVGLAGCDREFILEGERFNLRAPFDENAGAVPENRASPITLPTAVNHSAWTHRLGTASNRITHPAFGAAPQLIWSADIGHGNDRRNRITADPVAADGRIFTIDSRGVVTATATTGAMAWQHDLTPADSRNDDASGGGLAYAGGKLYVTSAHGILLALDPATGREIWSHRFTMPITGAPMVDGNRVFVVGSDSSGWVLNTADGRVDWEISGTPAASAVAGGASPALAGGVVLLPMPSGELIAARRDSGQQLWSTLIAGQRIGQAYGGGTDITGDPVVVGDRIFAGNASGRTLALNRADGSIIWSAREAAYGPVWPVGDSLFMISDRNRLLRLDARTGALIWAQELPLHTQSRESRRAEIFSQFGPILAGGRLFVASSDGLLRSFDPVSGASLAQLELPGGASSSPIVVDGAMYVVSGDGRLHAFR